VLNTLPVVAAARQPRSLVQIATSYADTPQPLSGVVSWSISNNSYFEADTFRVVLAASALPSTNNTAWFMSQDEIYVQISASESPANPDAPAADSLTTLIYGRVDTVDFDPVRTEVHLSGRDLSAAFIDNKLATEYTSQVASGIVSELASARNIPAQISATSTRIGTGFQGVFGHATVNQSEWDLICYLARIEGFVAFVSPTQGLYFGPDPRDTSNPYVIRWQAPTSSQAFPIANVSELDFSRSMTVAKGITVVVSSAQQARKTPVVEYYPSAPRAIQPGKASPFGDVQAYYFNTTPNSSPVQCKTLAQTKYNEIISHTMKMSARLPADGVLSISTPIQVQGTGTVCDQIYFPREITREFSKDEGYMMHAQAQNTDQALEDATVTP